MLEKDFDLRGIDHAEAPAGRVSDWEMGEDFSHLLGREDWNALMGRLKALGRENPKA